MWLALQDTLQESKDEEMVGTLKTVLQAWLTEVSPSQITATWSNNLEKTCCVKCDHALPLPSTVDIPAWPGSAFRVVWDVTCAGAHSCRKGVLAMCG